jgi:hypothetical protein
MTNILTPSEVAPPSDVVSNVTQKVSNVTQIRNSPIELKVRIPFLADLTALPNQFKKRKKRGYDYYAYILGLMVHKSEQKKLSYGTYYPLSSDVLRRLFRGDYYKVINALKAAGFIIEFSNPYSFIRDGKEIKCAGTYNTKKEGFGKAKKYALNISKFTNDQKKLVLKEYTITDKTLVQKINRQRIESTQRVIEAYPVAKKVYENIKLLSIEDAPARNFLYDKYDLHNIKQYGRYFVRKLGKSNTKNLITEIQKTKSAKKLSSIFKKYGCETQHAVKLRSLLGSYNSLIKRLHTIDTINNIAAGNYEAISISRDHKTGRLFHTLTMIPKDLKEFLRLDNQPLIEIDGSNAQWWLLVDHLKNLCNILDSKNFNFINTNTNTYKEVYIRGALQHPNTRVEEVEVLTAPPITYMLHAFSTDNKYSLYKGNVEREVYTLGVMLETGSFRKWFIEQYRQMGKEVSEGEVKARLIKYILFGNVNAQYYHDTDIVKLFKKRFPYIHQILVDLKTKHIDNNLFGYDIRDQWKCLALILQSKEAEVFVDGMLFTDAVFTTLHDAIITNKTNEYKVEKTLSNALKMAGVKMTLNRTEY